MHEVEVEEVQTLSPRLTPTFKTVELQFLDMDVLDKEKRGFFLGFFYSCKCKIIKFLRTEILHSLM